MSQRETGHVKWFNEKKGFGFIVNQKGEDIFVHYKDIQGVGFKTLHENDPVTFELDRGPKGLKAQNVVVASESVHTEE
ncbi:TPA: cold-shock protein [Legionella pneumophila]|jgi:CspA family cold shock protein|nr:MULTISPECIES: cold shock domain-containing protein [Legionella]ERH42246.1 cold-shock protein [Legionella pneumophila str. Leg01/11]ERH46844.1 cold-shock protein [Legionella pneumophila str. Leg01/53]ERI48308.1 cold-shock protein [Legionella pneumophila str. Leg01/20]ABQ54653.1 cold shock domain family protein CspA [Legionella pneumophila str. Corby]ADG24585.1 cold shock domain family protein CspA [Legionella pneumophila 2300/99 Alcoy]